MRVRSLAIVAVVVALDYAVWSWSLAGGRDLAGMISGLTLPPLLVILLVLVVVNVMRALGSVARRPAKDAAAQPRRSRTARRRPGRSAAPAIMGADTEDPAVAASGRSSSSKIAA